MLESRLEINIDSEVESPARTNTTSMLFAE
jgi:hypothetical protein